MSNSIPRIDGSLGESVPNLSRRLSVVIPSAGRTPWLDNVLKYWASLHVRVHVAVRPRRPEEGSVYREFCARIATALRQVHTPYVAVVGDDDVYTVSGLTSAIKALDQESSLDYIVGHAAYWVKQRKTLSPRDYIIKFHPAFYWWKPISQNPTATLAERLRSAGFVCWSVGRTESLTQYFAFSSEILPLHPLLAEKALHQIGKMLLRGRMLDQLLWIRHEKTTHHRSVRARRPVSPDDVEDYNFAMHRAAERLELPDQLDTIGLLLAGETSVGVRHKPQWNRRLSACARSVPETWQQTLRPLLASLGIQVPTSSTVEAAALQIGSGSYQRRLTLEELRDIRSLDRVLTSHLGRS